MAKFTPSRLFDLLPQIYRTRDTQPPSSGSLEAILNAIDQQVSVLRKDIDRLWDNFFIDTCNEWVVPYISDLVGTNLVNPVVLQARVDAAKTIHYRRRKGTLPIIEELARDVTAWSAKGGEFFQLLGWTQHTNHVRLGHGGWFDIRDDTLCSAVSTAFDQAAHTVDVRGSGQSEGWHNIRNIGIFLWRLQSYTLLDAEPANAGQPHRFHFNPISQPQPLFIQPDLTGLSQHPTDEDNVRGPINPRRLRPVTLTIDHVDPPDADNQVGLHIIPPDAPLARSWPPSLWLELVDPKQAADTLSATLMQVCENGARLVVTTSAALTKQRQVRAFPHLPTYYGQRRGFSVLADGELISPLAANPEHQRRVLIGDLCSWQNPDPGTLVIDVRLGRFAFAPGETPAGSITVRFNYGFSGNLGAGPYNRVVTEAASRLVRKSGGPSLTAALANWQNDPPDEAIIEIGDSQTHQLSLTSLAFRGSVTLNIDHIDPPDPYGLVTIHIVPADAPQAETWHAGLGIELIDPGDATKTVSATLAGVGDNGATLSATLDTALSTQTQLCTFPPLRLTIRAINGERPVILLPGSLAITGGNSASSLILDGLFISGGQIDLQGELGQFTIQNCTLDPGGGLASDGVKLRPAQVALSVSTANTHLNLSISRSIVGALRVPNAIERLEIGDTIIDAQGGAAIAGLNGADDYAAGATIQTATIYGRCWLQELNLGSEVLFNDPVIVRRKQNGCVRFSYLAPGSATPRRYHCLPPDDASDAENARLTSGFTSTRFSDPGYAQLSRYAPLEIATGAADGSEIGAFHFLMNPQRRQNLLMRLDEYLPFGLSAALINVL